MGANSGLENLLEPSVGGGWMRIPVLVFLVGFLCATGIGFAAEKTAGKTAGGKSAPACAALVFRPLPSGGTDGEQTAGSYKSRFARLELRATVENGAAKNYYLVAGGNRIASTPQVPQAASDCAASKKMPRPGPAKEACTGEHFTAVLAHVGEKRNSAAVCAEWRQLDVLQRRQLLTGVPIERL